MASPASRALRWQITAFGSRNPQRPSQSVKRSWLSGGPAESRSCGLNVCAVCSGSSQHLTSNMKRRWRPNAGLWGLMDKHKVPASCQPLLLSSTVSCCIHYPQCNAAAARHHWRQFISLHCSFLRSTKRLYTISFHVVGLLQWKCPLGYPNAIYDIIKCPLGCPLSKENVIRCSLGWTKCGQVPSLHRKYITTLWCSPHTCGALFHFFTPAP